jgi:integrase
MKRQRDAITVAIILYKSKILSNGEHPLMIRITKNRKRSYAALKMSCSLDLWDEKKNEPSKKHPKRDEIKAIIHRKLLEYQDVKIELKNKNKNVSASGLINLVERPKRSLSVLQFFREVYERLLLSEQVGNSKTYKFVYNSFKKFADKNKSDFSFSELDYSVLIKYESALRQRKVSENTLSIHFRTLRALYNLAILENIAEEKDYPFNNFKVSKFKTEANRRAISRIEIRKIEKLNLEVGSAIYEARQLFLFIYYGQGINYVDIAKLKWSNRNQDRISYIRSKTKKPLNFVLTDPLLEILNYWFPVTGNDSDNYIFPILVKGRHETAIQIDNRIHKMRTETNNLFKEIGKLVGVATPLTTYVSRHTFATTLKYQGISTAIISEAMGHKTEGITQSYLKSFDNNVIDAAVRNSL